MNDEKQDLEDAWAQRIIAAGRIAPLSLLVITLCAVTLMILWSGHKILETDRRHEEREVRAMETVAEESRLRRAESIKQTTILEQALDLSKKQQATLESAVETNKRHVDAVHTLKDALREWSKEQRQ